MVKYSDGSLRRVAQHNAEQKENFQWALVKMRTDLGVSREEMSTRSGWSLEQLREIEQYWHPWTMHEAVYYALCLGVKVNFSLTPEDVSDTVVS